MNKMNSILLIFLFTLGGVGAFGDESQKFADSAESIRPVLIGKVAPDASLKNLEGTPVSLHELMKDKLTVLVFYRGGWCPFCNAQLKDLKGIQGKLKKLGYQVIAVSADRPEKLKETLLKQKMEYFLYSDAPLNAARAYGIAFQIDDKTLSKYKDYGFDLEGASGEKHHALPVPSVFLINRKGEIVFSYVNPNYRVRLKGELLLSAARILKE